MEGKSIFRYDARRWRLCRVSLLGENKIAAEGKTIAPEDFAFHRMAATAFAVFMVVLWLFSRPQHFEAWLLANHNDCMCYHSLRLAITTWLLEPGISLGVAVSVVPGARIELATPAFSGRRSTTELPRQSM
jgi:hypothetical protein